MKEDVNMAKFTFNRVVAANGCEIEGLFVIEPTVYGDDRGYFMETFNEEFAPYIKHIDGSQASFVQDNESMSRKGVLRGMHFQIAHPQGKLVRVINGEVFDVAVDLRKSSKTFGYWHGIKLSSENKKQFYVPEGFAHGFLVLSETATFVYKCTNFYHPESESGILWNDPEIGIEWPILPDMNIILSEKDKKNHNLNNIQAYM